MHYCKGVKTCLPKLSPNDSPRIDLPRLVFEPLSVFIPMKRLKTQQCTTAIHYRMIQGMRHAKEQKERFKKQGVLPLNELQV